MGSYGHAKYFLYSFWKHPLISAVHNCDKAHHAIVSHRINARVLFVPSEKFRNRTSVSHEYDTRQFQLTKVEDVQMSYIYACIGLSLRYQTGSGAVGCMT